MDLPELPDRIRVATPEDVPAILRMIRELAEFEREPDAVKATPELLREAMFGPDSVASALIAVDDGGNAAGFALWYRTFSTWEGVPGLYLEDLYVSEHQRGSGMGRALLSALARIALHRGWTRLEWAVLRWNSDAIGFYDGLDARPLDDWLTYRISGPALGSLGS
ncbi:N-acetyltransferase family protein [Aeromicrobium sp.]|uniref:GNAT family N-acetyltransferase n=1 Tax=Aeromicrobium sp. TaxID=1871063 RepID=UPI003D6BE964